MTRSNATVKELDFNGPTGERSRALMVSLPTGADRTRIVLIPLSSPDALSELRRTRVLDLLWGA